jgi:hypothetical protein
MIATICSSVNLPFRIAPSESGASLSTNRRSENPGAGQKASTAAISPELGYGVHKERSRKSKVHQLFDTQGPEAAWVLGLKLKLKEGTLRSWFAAWKRLQVKSKDNVKTNSSTPSAIEPDRVPTPGEAAHL